ncbi:MAG: RedB protein [Planctomycetaceae bacterium]|nr:RedB protein [Planctomycetaceae bacterium]
MARLLPVDAENVDTKNPAPDDRLKGWLLVAVVTWFLLVAVGLGSLLIYANQPGRGGEPAATWPNATEMRYSRSKPTLLVFAHPRCPCTRATIDELAWIMTRCGNRVECRVHFVQPAGQSRQWVQSGMWEKASSIPGVTVLADGEGQLSELFGAETSGHAMLYDAFGKLLFEGGITPSRGHRGSNSGRERIVKLAIARQPGRPLSDIDQVDSTEEVDAESTCVFGCPLFSPQQRPATENLHAFWDR